MMQVPPFDSGLYQVSGASDLGPINILAVFLQKMHATVFSVGLRPSNDDDGGTVGRQVDRESRR
jgi:hypothetical protein